MTDEELARYEQRAWQAQSEGYDALDAGSYSEDVLALIAAVRQIRSERDEKWGRLIDALWRIDELEKKVNQLRKLEPQEGALTSETCRVR
jgi:hypothetical protein